MGFSVCRHTSLRPVRGGSESEVGMSQTPEPSVNDIPDNELLGRAVRDFRPIKRGDGGIYRFVAVMNRFGLGSTYAQQLCCRFGTDPYEKVHRS